MAETDAEQLRSQPWLPDLGAKSISGPLALDLAREHCTGDCRAPHIFELACDDGLDDDDLFLNLDGLFDDDGLGLAGGEGQEDQGGQGPGVDRRFPGTGTAGRSVDGRLAATPPERQDRDDDQRVVLFVRLREGIELDEELEARIERQNFYLAAIALPLSYPPGHTVRLGAFDAVAVLPRDHPLADQETVRLEDLAQETLRAVALDRSADLARNGQPQAAVAQAVEQSEEPGCGGFGPLRPLLRSRRRAKTNWATASVPYTGTLLTGMPRAAAAPTSTML